jgi:large subunit ribosomal protein L7/L12
MEDLLEKLGKLTLVEAAELVKKMEEKFGISAAAPVAVAVAGAPAAVVEEKTEFDVIFDSMSGDKKVDAIKKVREITNLPLMDAKKLVEGSGGVLKENCPKDEANKIKSELEALGAKITLK